MPKTKKKVSMNVMHILKSVMDYKVKPLHATIEAGRRAAQEEPVICEYISSLQQFISNSRYDRGDTLEAEQEVADYEAQAGAIRGKINRANDAAAQMVHANKFYASYEDACKKIEDAQQLKQLESQRAELENRLTSLERNMEACEINMTPNVYGDDVAEQSRDEYEHYSQEYDRTNQSLQIVLQSIKLYQK